MFMKFQGKTMLLFFLIPFFSNQGCSGAVSTSPMPEIPSREVTIPFSVTLTALSTKTPVPEPASTSSTAPTPPGTYKLFFHPALVIKYDPLVWDVNLHARELSSCLIGEQGPTDFNGPHTSDIVRLGMVEYEVLSFPDENERISKAYIADLSFSTEAGLPVFWVIATAEEWEECIYLAEAVLATLHFP